MPSAKGTPFAVFQGMAKMVPQAGLWPSGLAAVRPIIGHVLPVQLPVLLQDINADGFSAVATSRLRPGVAYDLRFALRPQTVVLRARLTQAMPADGEEDSGYMLRFEFVDPERDKAAIAMLLAQAIIAAL